MARALKYLFYLAVLAALGLVAYAMFAELPPPTREIVVTIPMPGAGGE